MQQYKAYAKVNIFLKITGKRGNYHEIISRFMRVSNLFDVLYFTPKEPSMQRESFEIIGDFDCSTEQNTLYKAYMALYQHTHSATLLQWMNEYAINVEKAIPAFAGLGGGSSDAATYLHMCNEILNLGLSLEELAQIGLHVGADVPFFIYGYGSANVSGIGEVVTPFDEELLHIKTITPKIAISTPKVYQVYREKFFHPITQTEAAELKNISSLEALRVMDAFTANDLFAPAMEAYPALKEYAKKGYFFSGSGSSFFWVEG